MPQGSYVKSFLTTSVTVASGSTVGSSAMNVPLMSAGIMPRGMAAGIQIWSIEFEIDTTAMDKLLTTTDQYVGVILSAVPVTAQKYVNDRDVLFKWQWYNNVGAAGVAMMNCVQDRDFYPAIPFYGQQLHLGVISGLTTTAITVYCKVWYSLVTLSQNEVLAQLQNQLT